MGFRISVGCGWVNEGGEDPLRGVDAEGVWAWIDNYCHTHPLEMIERAGTEFVSAHPR